MPLLVKRPSVLHLHPDPSQTRPSTRSDPSLKPSDSSSSLQLQPDPARPVSESGPVRSSNHSHSRLSHEIHPDDIADPRTDHDARSRPPKRFNLMKFRNFSESHLAARAKLDEQRMQHARQQDLPPLPAVPADGLLPTIVKTAPTGGMDPVSEPHAQHVEEERNTRPSLFKRAASSRGSMSPQKASRISTDEKRPEKKTALKWRRGKNSGLEDLHRLSAMHIGNNHAPNSAPPSYGDEANSALAVPLSQLSDPRFSESSRSDGSNGSSGDGHIYGSTTTTTHTVSTHTTFFRLPRRNKNRNSLFPLPVKIPPPDAAQRQDQQGPATPRASTQSNTSETQATLTKAQQTPPRLQRRHTSTSPSEQRPHSQSLPSSHAALTKSSSSFAEGTNSFRHSSERSQNSNTSSPLQPPMAFGLRDRSSTQSSLGQSSHEPGTPPAPSASGRNSTSTTGRSSFGGFLTLSRFRQSSDPHSPRHGSPGTNSKANSFAISREALVIPEREEGDTPGKYLERLESAVSRSMIAGILSKSSDPFACAVLRSYTRRFPFFGEPIDMSLRKFLLEAELPKETQQVDRVIQAFADRYHECNPGIFTNSDQAYIIAFSIMMLHTDAFNKNNKRKMTKQDYIKNTSGQGLNDDILACFYDNICYTPFVHYDEDVDINGEKVLAFKTKKSGGKLKSAIPGSEMAKKTTGPVDPYNLLVEQKLDTLRPPIKESIMLDDPYDYRGNQGESDPQYLQRAFTHTGVLQIISARSRPAAYESQFVNGQHNSTGDQQGIVDLKITKAGTLWRKSTRKKKTRSPWQEWGAILTGSQLYLFKNSHWAKGLMHQFLQHQKPGHPRTPVVFKPPLTDFKFDALIKTDNAVALVDHSYARHKHAFTFVRPGGQDEVLLADNEQELNDWLGLINYAAAFRAAGVRIRGMLGGTEEDLRNRDVRRLDSTNSVRSIQTAMGEVTLQNRGLSPQLQRQVMAARRQIMVQKIGEIEQEIADANRQLETMLRNARHLLVLAPIAPKTREDVIHSAARTDAMIKWVRRDIWRLKCHRDVLAMDVRLDGLSASELEKLAQEEIRQQQEADSAKKERPKVLSRLSSTRVAGPRSPPQSPTTNIASPERPSVGSFDTFRGADVFRTPPESLSPIKDEPWRLPPLNLDTDINDQHRPSVASTLLSASPPAGHRGSLTHSSSASSMLQTQRTHSTGPSESGRAKITPTPSINEKDVELLARSTMGPPPQKTSSRGPSIDVPHSSASPESKRKGVRRSLQKTLRDAHHHHPGSMHKHRRNKDSESTVRSAGVDSGEGEEATPRLQRDNPRFILHGKQASVVQFGGDWERMKLRREQYEGQNAVSPAQASKEAEFAAFERRRSDQHELFRAGMMSPAAQEFARRGENSIDEDDDDDDGSMLSEQSFREDVEAAAAYSATEGTTSSRQSENGGVTDGEFFDVSPWEQEDNRRTTVIGPSRPLPSQGEDSATTLRHRRFSSLEKGEDGNVRVVDEDTSEDDDDGQQSPSSKSKNRHNRRTVIGPFDQPYSSPAATRRRASNSSHASIGSASFSGKGKGRENASSSSPASVAAASRRLVGSRGSVSTCSGAPPAVVEEEQEQEQEQEHEGSDKGSRSSVEGENGFVEPISDEVLRAMSDSLGRDT